MDIGHTTVDIGVDALLFPVVELFAEGDADPIDPRRLPYPVVHRLAGLAWMSANPVARLVNRRHLRSFPL